MVARVIIVAAIAAQVAACAPAVVGLTEYNNYRTQGRSATGWLITMAGDEDCDPLRKVDRKPVCRADPGPPPVDPICYASLGSVVCFDTPDPLMPRSRLMPTPGQTR